MFCLVAWVKQLVALPLLSFIYSCPFFHCAFYALHCHFEDVLPYSTLSSKVPTHVQLDVAGSVAIFCALTTLNNGNYPL